jgi:hypothetical protein
MAYWYPMQYNALAAFSRELSTKTAAFGKAACLPSRERMPVHSAVAGCRIE